MAIKYLSDINLNKNQLQSVRLHNLATAPNVTQDDIGQIYFDTTDDVIYVYDGTGWNSIGGDIESITSSTADQLTIAGGTGPNPALTIVTGAVANDDSGLVTGDTVFDYLYDNAQSITIAGTANEVTAVTNNTGDNTKLQLGNTLTIGLPDDVTIGNDLTVTGNLRVDGTTTTVNSTVVTIDDPVFTLGGDTAPTTDDDKDRGIEFRYHDGTDAKLGFFGFDDSKQRFSFFTDAANNTEVFSGTDGSIDIADLRLSGSIKSVNGSAPTNGQILIGSTAGADMSLATLTAGGGIDITNAAGAITIAVEAAAADNAGIVELATPAEALAGSSDTLAVTPEGLAARSFSATIGDAAAVSYQVTHNLGTKDVIVQLYELSTGDTIFTDIERNDTNEVTLNFATAPATSNIRVLITKID